MWRIKTFKTSAALWTWVRANEGRIQFIELAVNNGWAVQYRPLREV